MAEPGPAGGLLAFTAERFHPLVSAPLALVLAAAGTPPTDRTALLPVAVSAWLLLFAQRAWDDLADLSRDRTRRPARVLPSGRVSPGAVAAAALAAWVAALALATFCAPAAGLLLLLHGGLMALTGAGRRPAWPLLQPLLVDLALPVALLLGPLAAGGEPKDGLLLAGCAWLAAAGHDLVHGIEDESGWPPHLRDPLPAGSRAGAGTALLGAALLLGLLAAVTLRDPAIGLALLPGVAWLGPRLVALRRDPSPARARPLRVTGFALVMLPVLGRAASRWLG